MNSSQRLPAIGIISESDAPSARMLVLLWPGKRGLYWQYLQPRPGFTTPQPFRGGEFTDLRTFGMKIEKIEGDSLTVTRAGESKALYRDQTRRIWQDDTTATVDVLKSLAPTIRTVARFHREDAAFRAAAAASPELQAATAADAEPAPVLSPQP